MADSPEEQEQEEVEAFEAAILGAGALIRSNHTLLVNAYAENNRSQLLAQRSFRENLKKVIAEYDEADNKAFDNCTSGYMDASWLDGIERLRKQREEKESTVKVDPAASC